MKRCKDVRNLGRAIKPDGKCNVASDPSCKLDWDRKFWHIPFNLALSPLSEFE